MADLRRDSPGLALFLLTAISTVGFIDRIIMNVLVEPIRKEFGLSDTQIGLLVGLAFAVLNVALGLVVARIAERRDRVPLIALGTFLWSLATAACGMVANGVQLVLARIGVGVGEAVGLPATASVISDYFPPRRRATAMSVLALAPPIGALLGSAGGAWIAQHYGWREAFIAAAIPGGFLALAAWLWVAEPPRGRHDAGNSDEVPPLGAVLGRFWRVPTARHLLAGSAIASMVGFGLNAFLAAMLARKFGFSLVEAGVTAGLVASFPSTVSVLAGGWLADRLGARRPSAYVLVPGLCLLLAAPLYLLAITRPDATSLLVLLGLSALVQYTYLGCTSGLFQNLMAPRMRATSTAFTSMVYTLIGSGMGPLLLGWLSERYAPAHPQPGASLVWAMGTVALLYLWAALHYLLAARHVGADLAAARGISPAQP